MDTHSSQMSTGEVTVPASSFKQQTDRNIQPSPINVSLGGIPMHWLSTAPMSRRDMKMNLTPTNFTPTVGANPKSYKVMRFHEFHEGRYKGNNK
jgi:hypothetical protein